MVVQIYFLIHFYRTRRRIDLLLTNASILFTEPSIDSLDGALLPENIQEITGLTEQEAKQLEYFRFARSGYTDSFVKNTPCAVCTEEFKEEENMIKLPVCHHLFHRSCIESWLLTKAVCPLCRSNVHTNLETALLSQ